MKYFKITLPKQKGGNLIYPPNYQDEIGDYAVDHLYFDEDGVSKLLLLIEDVNAKNIIRENVEEVSETDAITISNIFETKTEQITDEGKIRRLELKAALSIPLTTDELKAIDPADPTSGFGYTEILADRLITAKQLELTKAIIEESPKEI